ncbi:hypothetical protein EOA13_34460 [Mesorhizobium sp. M7A.F.Ca.US.011.01.1.1]|uniref:hypothetical protein n=1 Tax=Mesorhizobium sp. M7A.F.Ca.US.011.01.1.1 TaxID=2496741 RepID=UPI000FC99E63|nr:hypothetical protein [Mesorhizobium sp. M7A.F.Ca.US.011.01.1.1]RUX23198.1 hypothetical protein EOA13_34460 [Mesorhizobium sp. M7A.F.Ca.US.011.01.1.1]
MYHLQLFRTLSGRASAGFNPRVYLLSIALGGTVADHCDPKRPLRAGERRP